MLMTVIVPTYRRPQELEQCLTALQKQTRPADEILVIVRDTDLITQSFLKTFNTNFWPLKIIQVTIPGVIAALNTGLEKARGDIISITDDDAAPHVDWLARIEAHFCLDQNIGGVGGRDWLYQNNKLENGARNIVGKVQWFGRVIGNHHLGVGEAREVDVLKGVNMSYRRKAIADLRFDERMRGTGAQVNFEMAFCFALKRSGWKLLYDPKVAVNHYPASRFDEDQRGQFHEIAWINTVHNETLALLEYLSPLKNIIFIVWSFLIGTRQSLGFLQWLRFLLKKDSLASKKWLASLRGRWEGLLTWQQHHFIIKNKEKVYLCKN